MALPDRDRCCRQRAGLHPRVSGERCEQRQRRLAIASEFGIAGAVELLLQGHLRGWRGDGNRGRTRRLSPSCPDKEGQRPQQRQVSYETRMAHEIPPRSTDVRDLACRVRYRFILPIIVTVSTIGLGDGAGSEGIRRPPRVVRGSMVRALSRRSGCTARVGDSCRTGPRDRCVDRPAACPAGRVAGHNTASRRSGGLGRARGRARLWRAAHRHL